MNETMTRARWQIESAPVQDPVVFFSFLLLSFAAGVPGMFFSADAWYENLVKPSWTAPNELFGPIWALLYLAMATAAYRVWRQPGSRDRSLALVFFGLQLLLNALWSPLFFGAHLLGWALVEIILLDLAIVAFLYFAARVDRQTLALLLPYLAWALYATDLSAAIYLLNPGA